MPFYPHRGRSELILMWERMEEQKRPELKDPVLLVSLSTSIQQYRVLYSQAR